MVRTQETDYMTSPVKKYQRYNTSIPKNLKGLVRHSHIANSKASSSKKEKKGATKAKTSGATQLTETDALKNLGRRVERATPSGGILTERFPVRIPGSSAPPAGAGSMPPDPDASDPLPFPDIDSPTLDSIATADRSPSKEKRRVRTAFQREKRSAWGHWRKDVLSMALEIYLEVEAKRAARQPPPPPPVSEVVDTHLVGDSQTICAKCQTPIEKHSVLAIQLSSMYDCIFISLL